MAAVTSTLIPALPLRRSFQRRLLRWYSRHRRDLPWRRTTDPYQVLVSEIMLQQTQVERVIPKYHEFLTRYPSFESLARARPAEVKRTWYPLGYNIRPVHLQGIARETIARYGGRLPDDARVLRSLRGIGPYTAGAILSFAYGRDAAVVDTNVRRVLSRVFRGPRRRPRRGAGALWVRARGQVWVV
jgi:A/G-specific adenine glycosylase